MADFIARFDADGDGDLSFQDFAWRNVQGDDGENGNEDKKDLAEWTLCAFLLSAESLSSFYEQHITYLALKYCYSTLFALFRSQALSLSRLKAKL